MATLVMILVSMFIIVVFMLVLPTGAFVILVSMQLIWGRS